MFGVRIHVALSDSSNMVGTGALKIVCSKCIFGARDVGTHLRALQPTLQCMLCSEYLYTALGLGEG